MILMHMFAHDSARAFLRLRSPVPGPVVLRARDDIFWCYAVLRFPRPRHRAGFRLWSYAVIWLMICLMMWYAVFGVYGDLKPSGVMLCVAPASEWWPRSWALCMISICIICICFQYRSDILIRYFLSLYFYFSYDLDFCTLCFTYSVHLSYWPPFFGGCVSCPQVQRFVICQCRPHILLLQSAPFDPEPICWYISVMVYMYFCTFDYLGYGGALSRHMIPLWFVEACSHLCGSWVLCMFDLFMICILARSRLLWWPWRPLCLYMCIYVRRCIFRRLSDFDMTLLYARPPKTVFIFILPQVMNMIFELS